jgi:hypothetical protein
MPPPPFLRESFLLQPRPLSRKRRGRLRADRLWFAASLLFLTQCVAPDPGIQRAARHYEENVDAIDRSPGPDPVQDRAR